MRAEGPLDWTVQTLVIGPDEYVAINLPDDIPDEAFPSIRDHVADAWPGARVLFTRGDIRITSIEQED